MRDLHLFYTPHLFMPFNSEIHTLSSGNVYESRLNHIHREKHTSRWQPLNKAWINFSLGPRRTSRIITHTDVVEYICRVEINSKLGCGVGAHSGPCFKAL